MCVYIYTYFHNANAQNSTQTCEALFGNFAQLKTRVPQGPGKDGTGRGCLPSGPEAQVSDDRFGTWFMASDLGFRPWGVGFVSPEKVWGF